MQAHSLRLGSWFHGNWKHGIYLTPFQLDRLSPINTTQGTVVGPDTSNELKRTFGSSNVATEGIDYAADLAPNFLPGGTDTASKQLMQNMINSMASRCPDSIIVTGGYSQGAAVNHRAIEGLSSSVKDRIAGVILYGDTQRLQVSRRAIIKLKRR